MKIYISGISGTGMGPLALMAKQAGHEVYGSDLHKGAVYDELVEAGCDVFIGEQDGKFLKKKLKDGVDWFSYTSALPEDHPELVMAKEAKVKVTKRDDLTAFLVKELGLKMVAVAGTHGKTTTTAMIVWASLKLGLPVAYLVGTTLGFAPSGAYHPGDKYFIYEADEYDRNFLKYHPWLAIIPFVSYDHPDIYPTEEDYKEAFETFKSQSEKVIEKTLRGVKWQNLEPMILKEKVFGLAGEARRIDASLAGGAVFEMMKDSGKKLNYMKLIEIMDDFPGVGRRFEKLADGLYTDYAHHPEEVKATVEIALEQAKLDKKKGVVVIYQPHQNTRQHEVKSGYHDAFDGITKLYWLPTYLTRENQELAVITPAEFIKDLDNSEVAEVAKLDSKLFNAIKKWREDNYLMILMTAGPADEWLRDRLSW